MRDLLMRGSQNDLDNPITMVEYDLSPKGIHHEATPTVQIENRKDASDFQVRQSIVAHSQATHTIKMSLIDGDDANQQLDTPDVIQMDQLPEHAQNINRGSIRRQHDDLVLHDTLPSCTEPESDPYFSDLQLDELNKQDKECLNFVQVDAYSLAKCTQRKIKELTYAKRDERKLMTYSLLQRVTQSIDKLIEFQSEAKKCSPFARHAAYICQSILMFEQYKLESADSDLNKKIKQLLHILKHLAF